MFLLCNEAELILISSFYKCCYGFFASLGKRCCGCAAYVSGKN